MKFFCATSAMNYIVAIQNSISGHNSVTFQKCKKKYKYFWNFFIIYMKYNRTDLDAFIYLINLNIAFLQFFFLEDE